MDFTNATLTVAVVAAAVALNQYVVGPLVCRWFGDTDQGDQEQGDQTDDGTTNADEEVEDDPIVTVTDEVTLGSEAEPVTPDAGVESTPAPVGRGVRRLARRVVARRAALTGRN